MTPTFLIAILAILPLLLVGLLTSLASQWRQRDTAPRPKAAKNRKAAKPVPEPATSNNVNSEDRGIRMPTAPGRKRQLGSISAAADDNQAESLFDGAVYANSERRLEQAFDIYSQGRVSLDTYEVMILAEGERAKRLRSELRAKELAGNSTVNELDAFREEIEMIEVAVQWCLDWANDLRKPAQSSDTGSGNN